MEQTGCALKEERHSEEIHLLTGIGRLEGTLFQEKAKVGVSLGQAKATASAGQCQGQHWERVCILA